MISDDRLPPSGPPGVESRLSASDEGPSTPKIPMRQDANAFLFAQVHTLEDSKTSRKAQFLWHFAILGGGALTTRWSLHPRSFFRGDRAETCVWEIVCKQRHEKIVNCCAAFGEKRRCATNASRSTCLTHHAPWSVPIAHPRRVPSVRVHDRRSLACAPRDRTTT